MIDYAKPSLKSIDIRQLLYFRIVHSTNVRNLITNKFFQLILMPLVIISLTVYSLETLFVGVIEQNYQIQMLAVCFIYFTFHMYIVALLKVDAIVRSGSKARHTGVLIHEALINTKDLDLITKVLRTCIHLMK